MKSNLVSDAGMIKPNQSDSSTIESTIEVTGLDCLDCAEKLVEKIQKLSRTAGVKLNFGAGLIKVTHSGPVEDIIDFITASGYGAKLAAGGSNSVPAANNLKRKQVLAVISGFLLSAGLVGSWTGFDKEVIYFFALAMGTGGFYVYKSAVNSLRYLVFDMNVLMAMSSIGAAFIGQWSEAATVVFLFSMGNMLQAYTMERTRDSIKRMIALAPQEARIILTSGIEETIPVDQVKIGDTVLVKPGEYIPVDGTVAGGFSWVNQASITGESKPVEKKEGDGVFAGSLNNEGSLIIVVKHIASDCTLAKMIHLVEEAQAKKAPSQQFVDVFAHYYTPAVIVGALLVVLIPVLVFNRPFVDWFYKALVLLVISCPCALIISTPVSIISAIGNSARNGVLIKGGAYLESLGEVKNIAFDKTGTLTTGELVVTSINPVAGISEEQLLQAAGTVERFSEHPAAKSVMTAITQRDILLPESDTFLSYPGKGASCRVGGKNIYVGNQRLFDELGIATNGIGEIKNKLEKEGQSVIFVSFDDRFIGMLAIADTPRLDAQAMLADLKRLGIQNILMLSGDNEKTVAGVAANLGIDNFRADLLPGDKVKEVAELAGAGITMMVGDGVNDAPALAAATIGVAMGAAGTDTVLETADVALMNDELLKIPAVIKIGRKTRLIIKQNIAVSLILKLVFLVFTFAGIANLWMAVFADTGASLLVTFNGMRLARFKF